jgi:hypothetical protein
MTRAPWAKPHVKFRLGVICKGPGVLPARPLVLASEGLLSFPICILTRSMRQATVHDLTYLHQRLRVLAHKSICRFACGRCVAWRPSAAYTVYWSAQTCSDLRAILNSAVRKLSENCFGTHRSPRRTAVP